MEDEDLDPVGAPPAEPIAFFRAAAEAAGVIRKGDPLDQMLIDYAYAIVERCAVIGQAYSDDDFGNAGEQIVNTDAFSAGPSADPPLAPPEWTMDVQYVNGGYEGVVKRTDTVMCHIMLGGHVDHLPVARAALAPKARAWVADYLSRP